MLSLNVNAGGAPRARPRALLRSRVAGSESKVDAPELIAIFVAVALAGAITASTGFGFGLLLVPPLVFVIGPRDAVVVSNVLSLVFTSYMLTQMYGDVARRTTFTLSAFAALGIPLGFAILVLFDQSILQAFIATFVLVSTVLLTRGIQLHRGGIIVDGLVGFVAGVLRTSTSMSGPPVVIYLQGQGVSPAVFRASMTAFFCATGAMASVAFLIGGRFTEDVLLAMAVGVFALPLGWRVGNTLFHRMPEEAFRKVVIVTLFVSGIVAFAGAFIG